MAATATRAMTDAEVSKEMEKMACVAFIKQEALEKAKEIKIKADEEFNIEKAKLVRQETATIDALFQKKMKQAEVQRKIAASNYSNKAKVRVLQLRHDLLGHVHTDTRAQLRSLVERHDEYKPLVEDLLVQGLLDLLEPEAVVLCLARDVELVESVLDAAAHRFQEMAQARVKVTVDKSNPLPESEIGGVIVTSANGRIKVLNSLEARLQIACEKLLPDIRVKLYGAPPNRRFFD
ncbi:hypothetical protein AMAG_09629 [Allomyces macrogynus ATCC 38327]|uniref:V-type proton ATPase subunit E n=1 Tax=Allomyces macrogynus (strain ATCC 38327) TaxID=578462 RepID=A0A0L0ST14_ALLM3|nr:hypothetical protein AMAG_09629 [Allomyces macrogynus ATCC 38327]|eukprot:KNE65647.1 hypothetical protein AMAG_09629 [Allomyces macrogynus ATCC 38327]